jgi:hypothetical protein
MKIKKLNITEESAQREREIRMSLPNDLNWKVMSQTNNVIEDKINEIIDYLNTKQEEE